jgi:hypothetical protein
MTTRPTQEPGRNYPNWIEAIVDAYPDTPIPARYRRWAAISAISGALGRKCWYDWGPYLVYPQQFIVLVGPRGVGKTAALSLPYSDCFNKLGVPAGAQEPDPDNPADTGNGWKWGWQEYQLKNPLRFLIGRVTTEQLVKDIAHAEREDHEVSSFEETVTTAEISLVTNEFKVFVNRNDGYQDGFMTDAWDGLPASYRTKHQGRYYIESPFVNWIAGATPEQFVDNMPPGALEQGWMSRILPVWWAGRRMDEDIEYPSPTDRTIKFLRSDLAQIAQMRGQFFFEDDELKEEVRGWIKSGGPPRPTDPKLAGYLERRASHFMKVTMAVAAANHQDAVIKRQDFLQAQSYLLEIEEDMPKALALFGSSDVGRTSLDLANMVQLVFQTSKRGMPLSEFKNAVLKRARSAGDVNSLVQAMDSAGLIRVDANTQTVYPADMGTHAKDIPEETKVPDRPVDDSPEAEMSSKIP